MYEPHPAAAVMPPLPDKEYQKLVDSIKADGLIESIKLLGDQVIDGNHRQLACNDAGVKPRFEQVETDDPVRYVLSCNTRRHLTTKQRAAVAAELANMGRGTNQYKEKVDTSNDVSISEKEAATLMSVSVPSVQRAKKTMREDPEAHKAAKEGKPVKKKKSPKVKRVSWTSITAKYGLSALGNAGMLPSRRKALKSELVKIDPGIEFTKAGVTPDMADRIDRAAREIAMRKDPAAFKKAEERKLEEVSPYLSMSAAERLEAAIRSAKKALEAEYEWRVQQRITAELKPALAEYNRLHDKHIEIINTYEGVLTHREYKLITGLLHSDRLPGVDDVLRKRFDKGFDIMQQKRELLCGLSDNEKLTSTLPRTVEELLRRRK